MNLTEISPITVKSAKYQSKRGANTKNTIFPKHVFLSTEIVTAWFIPALTPTHLRFRKCESIALCRALNSRFLGVHKVRSVRVSIQRPVKAVQPVRLDFLEGTNGINYFLTYACVMA